MPASVTFLGERGHQHQSLPYAHTPRAWDPGGHTSGGEPDPFLQPGRARWGPQEVVGGKGRVLSLKLIPPCNTVGTKTCEVKIRNHQNVQLAGCRGSVGLRQGGKGKSRPICITTCVCVGGGAVSSRVVRNR